MAASKVADFWGALPGHACQYSDADMAYTQAIMGGDPTFVRLPKAWWPASWHKFKDPCCRMLRALYGHPDAGYYWEKHCRAIVQKLGFTEVPNWPNVYFMPERQLLLVVYVDDFKLAGPAMQLEWGWKELRKHITMDDPLPVLCTAPSSVIPKGGSAKAGNSSSEPRVHRYLGCDHQMETVAADSKQAQKLLSETAFVRLA